MVMTISGVLDAAAVGEARELIATLAWRDGAETAGKAAARVKRNQQADLTSRTGASLRTLLGTAISAHPVLRAAAQPRRFSKLLVSRTGPGGGYGLHMDNAFMGEGETALRTDLSFTLFLSDPETYDGGDLAIEDAGLTQSVKLPAGDLVLYPATRLHRVEPVTGGTRLVCVGWIESTVRLAADREILFDLETLRADMAATHTLDSPEMLVLSKTISNLLRRFS